MTAKTTRFDFDTLSPRERYKLLIGTVVPRPIALVTTVDMDGRVNAAPFSFYNVLTADPPILALGIENRRDMTFKHTAQNIRLTEEFVVNVVDEQIAEAMNTCAIAFPEGVDEVAEAGLTTTVSSLISAPRITEAPAAYECVRHMTLELGRSREIVLGRVVALHLRTDLLETGGATVDQARLRAVGRMGADFNVRTRDMMDMPTPRLEDWMSRKAKASI